MTAKQVLTWPHSGLRIEADYITDVTSEEVRQCAEDLKDTLRLYNAQGVAATQIGSSLRMLAYKEPSGTVMVLVNPEIVESSGELKASEGCLSFPGVTARIKRYENLTVKATTVFGDDLVLQLTGLEAVAIQHELDHLNGKVMLDYMSRMEVRMALKRLAKVKRRLGAYAA